MLDLYCKACTNTPDTNCCCCAPGWIPWFLAFSDLMFCIGQGMTVKFFYVYFAEIVGESIVYLAGPCVRCQGEREKKKTFLSYI